MELDEKNYLLDIKSKHIIKDIFLYLNEKQKLNLIIYNKQLQIILGVDIKEYQKISGKLKIGQKNGEGKEYDLDKNKLIFKGKYLNGKRNGEGKEYYCDGNLKFEGEYLNGKRWKGKGYNEEGDIECEIKKGKGYIKI